MLKMNNFKLITQLSQIRNAVYVYLNLLHSEIAKYNYMKYSQL